MPALATSAGWLKRGTSIRRSPKSLSGRRHGNPARTLQSAMRGQAVDITEATLGRVGNKRPERFYLLRPPQLAASLLVSSQCNLLLAQSRHGLMHLQMSAFD